MTEEEDQENGIIINNNNEDNNNLDTNSLVNDKQEKQENGRCNSVSHFIYFLMVPTTIYSPWYPKRKSINWFRVSYLLMFTFTIGYFNLKLVRHYHPAMSMKQIPLPILIQLLFYSSGLHSVFILLIDLFAMWLHCWNNVYAEILLFGDRRFYGDFYSQTNIADYFLKWNYLFQNWLYRYIYKPVRIMTENRILGGLAASFFSGFVLHDYLVWASIGFLSPGYSIAFPVFVVLFGNLFKTLPGSPVTFYNFIPFQLMIVLQGAYMALISIEFFVRKYCDSSSHSLSLLNMVIPKSIECLKLA